MSPEEKPVNAAKPTPPTAGADPEGEKTPAQIRAEIDQTRGELGDTVEALAEKTDVKAQAKAKVDDVRSQAQAKADEAKAKAKELGDKAREAAPKSPQQATQQAQAAAEQVQEKAKQYPRPFVIAGGVVVLFILWRWLRS